MTHSSPGYSAADIAEFVTATQRRDNRVSASTQQMQLNALASCALASHSPEQMSSHAATLHSQAMELGRKGESAHIAEPETEWLGMLSAVPATLAQYVRSIGDRLHTLLWVPDFANPQFSSPATPTDTHSFPINIGTIWVECQMNAATGSLTIEWDADTRPDNVDLWALFFKPGANALWQPHRPAHRIGSGLIGSREVSIGELGFDPRHDPWSVLVTATISS